MGKPKFSSPEPSPLRLSSFEPSSPKFPSSALHRLSIVAYASPVPGRAGSRRINVCFRVRLQSVQRSLSPTSPSRRHIPLRFIASSRRGLSLSPPPPLRIFVIMPPKAEEEPLRIRQRDNCKPLAKDKCDREFLWTIGIFFTTLLTTLVLYSHKFQRQ